MSNFNFSNLSINKLLHQVRQVLKQDALPMSTTQGSATSLQMGLNSQLQSIIKDSKLPLSQLLNNESLRLNPQEVSAFIKETMKLPQEIRFLLLMLALESSPADVKQLVSKNLREIIEQNLNNLSFSPEEVQKMLDKSRQNATEVLIKLLQNSTINQTRSGQQVMELMSNLGKLGEKIKASPAEALETLMLLYIPWYPLAAQQKIDLSFESGEAGEEEATKDISLVIYLQTNTLGRFKIMVSEVDPLQVVVKLLHEEIAKPFIPEFENHINIMLAKEGLPAAIFEDLLIQEKQELSLPVSNPASQSVKKPEEKSLLNKETSDFARATRQSDHREIAVQPGKHLSLLVMNTAYTLARYIFEKDEANQPLQK